jgi:hypothetical protein
MVHLHLLPGFQIPLLALPSIPKLEKSQLLRVEQTGMTSRLKKRTRISREIVKLMAALHIKKGLA